MPHQQAPPQGEQEGEGGVAEGAKQGKQPEEKVPEGVEEVVGGEGEGARLQW